MKSTGACWQVAAVPQASWREVGERLETGARLVTAWGRRSGEQVLVTTLFETSNGELSAMRTFVPSLEGVHELTSRHPAMHCFERELHEQTGLRVGGHPWLKPLRFEGALEGKTGTYPFHDVTGKEVHEVAVGPIHAGVIEPGAFRFMCTGEEVRHLEIQLGFQHRGVERALLGTKVRHLLPLAETIAGDSSVAHAWALAGAIEALAGRRVEGAVERSRAIALELERVAMHLAGLSGLSTDIGFLPGATTYGRLRTTAINTSMILCGSRFGRSAIRLGGSGLRASKDLLETARANVRLLVRDLEPINQLFHTAASVRHRLVGVGRVTKDQVRSLGFVGMTARSAGVALDARAGATVYAQLEARTVQDGDCWARALLRIEELGASLRWLEGALAIDEPWQLGEVTEVALAADSLAVSVVEGWRGEVVHCVETGADGAFVHVKVQDPSLRNWLALALAVRGEHISDFPICNKSFDLSYCGNDL